jgi:2-polyprenyl-3-methyl-5-hydroxy-6-metoxy-1,4-benzoquinol methylase
MDRPSVHISYAKSYTWYHQVLTGLVLKYTPPGGRILDLGCGFGHLLELVHRSDPGYALTGADAFEACVEGARARVPAARTVLVDETRIDFDVLGKDFQTCVMAHSLEHMLDPVSTLRELMERIVPGGHLVLAVPNPVRPTVFFGNLRRRHYVNEGHVFAWDRSHWMNFLERILGLDVVEYASDEVKLFSARALRVAPFLKKLEIALSRRVPWWSFSNIAVVRKAE